jgi:predicted nucleic acid-binding protein
MTARPLLFDTNAILLLAQGNANLLEIASIAKITTSVLNRFEIFSYWKITEKEIKLFEDFFNGIDLLELSNSIYEIAIIFRRKYKMKAIDSIIAASAFVYNTPLVTCDKDFQNIEEVTVIIIDL